MAKKKRPHRTRKNSPEVDGKDDRDTITLKHSSYNPGKAELEEVVRLEDCLDVPLETFGKTPEERMGNLVRHQFRQVKIRRDK